MSGNPEWKVRAALATLGFDSLAEYAKLLGLDAVNLADPCDRLLIEQAAIANARKLEAYCATVTN